MNSLKIFRNREIGIIRALQIEKEPYFIGKDVTDILGYSNSRKALIDHVDSEDKGVTKCDTLGGVQKLTVINESGLYSLILSSKMPTAKKFKHWVTKEVLPSIRKNGGYIANQENLTPEQIVANALVVANNIINSQKLEIEEMKPKALFADCVSTSNTAILVGDLAKLLKQNGIDMGANRLFKWLRDNGYLIKRKGTDYNMPTQKSMELKIFEIKETTITHSDKAPTIRKTPKVNGKGQRYFINKFIEKQK